MIIFRGECMITNFLKEKSYFLNFFLLQGNRRGSRKVRHRVVSLCLIDRTLKNHNFLIFNRFLLKISLTFSSYFLNFDIRVHFNSKYHAENIFNLFLEDT